MSVALRAVMAVSCAVVAMAGCKTPAERGRAPIPAARHPAPREEPFVKRALELEHAGRWIGEAIAYGPYRDGQGPDGAAPSKAELQEDLVMMSEHWGLLRLYGSIGPPETILEVIREEALDMKVVLGVWIAAEARYGEEGAVVETFPDARAANSTQVEAAIRLAEAYPNVVLAVSVGNEARVSWSDHVVSHERMVELVRDVRARTHVPVTVADDYKFWVLDESRALADELDFVMTHAHPMWNGIGLEEALAWTRQTVAQVQAVHPDHLVVLGETGWATMMHDEGEQARLIQGQPGEQEQRAFYHAVNEWVRRDRVPTFFFEAFDEAWKGGEHPNEVEKHWGLFRADRTPKAAMTDGA